MAGLHAYDKVVYFEVVVTPENGAPWQVLRTPARRMIGNKLHFVDLGNDLSPIASLPLGSDTDGCF